ncbi:MAG: 3-oxoacid CoA-transferase subunit A [Firmicutes bacterium]|jgi:acetate CoA/acetoacetate CoA-transferase alpha subunit|nr:3-oxoacid CoA-transferase subunit A [Bacillota bacterium]MDH7496463.1 3-oxoacid CoA-transferase subunit A [Bacillota bacterium]
MNKVKSIADAVGLLHDGMTVMLPGFLGVGTPKALVEAVCERGVRALTVICNDGAFPDVGLGKLVKRGLVRKLIGTHTGTNPELARLVAEKGIDLELYPQGTLVEKIRAGGAGLGGILTPTGVGTAVEEGKSLIEIGGRAYLLELPLRADVALLYAHIGDRAGNLVYRRAARNFNPIMASAADLVIAEVANLVEVGEIDPDRVMTPGIFVDVVVRGVE